MFRAFIGLVLFATLPFVLSCSRSQHYTSPFAKTFVAENEEGVYQINLHRYTVGDSITSYSGYVIQGNLNQGRPFAISHEVEAGAKDLIFGLGQEKKLLVEINKGGDRLKGRLVIQDSNTGKERESVPFVAEAVAFPFSFAFHEVSDTRKLYPEITNSPDFQYSFELLEPRNDSLDSLVFDQFKSNLYRRYNVSDTVESLIGTYLDQQIDERFKYDRKSTAEEYADGSAYATRSFLKETYHILFARPWFVSMAISHFENSSDASHSLENEYFVNYDLNTGKPIQLSNVLNRHGYNIISQLITDQIRMQKGLKPGQSLRDAWYDVERVRHTDNFFLTAFGIGFQYNIYEIASYASGPTTVFIPFSILEGGVYPEILDLLR